MVGIDLERFVQNLSEIPQEQEVTTDDRKELKKLLLVLAGDQRVIRKLTLEDVSDLFNSAQQLLDSYESEWEYGFKTSALEDYMDAGRRAV